MSNVTLTIGGRDYAVACADGEEAHIEALGRTIDDKLKSMGGMGGQNESRTLLFAALLLADELHEARAAPVRLPSADQDPDRLDRLARRLENCATMLERRAPAS